MAQSLAYRTGELRYGDFYIQLKETCRKRGSPYRITRPWTNTFAMFCCATELTRNSC
jgi:hypothetical protein